MSVERRDPKHSPEVQGPNNRPRPHEFDTVEIIYGDGFPDIPEPQWMKDEAERMQGERERRRTDDSEEVKGSRLRLLNSIISAESFWYGGVIDSDYRDRQNGITPPFEP